MKVCPVCGISQVEYMCGYSSSFCPDEGIEKPEDCGFYEDDDDTDDE